MVPALRAVQEGSRLGQCVVKRRKHGDVGHPARVDQLPVPCGRAVRATGRAVVQGSGVAHTRQRVRYSEPGTRVRHQTPQRTRRPLGFAPCGVLGTRTDRFGGGGGGVLVGHAHTRRGRAVDLDKVTRFPVQGGGIPRGSRVRGWVVAAHSTVRSQASQHVGVPKTQRVGRMGKGSRPCNGSETRRVTVGVFGTHVVFRVCRRGPVAKPVQGHPIAPCRRDGRVGGTIRIDKTFGRTVHVVASMGVPCTGPLGQCRHQDSTRVDARTRPVLGGTARCRVPRTLAYGLFRPPITPTVQSRARMFDVRVGGVPHMDVGGPVAPTHLGLLARTPRDGRTLARRPCKRAVAHTPQPSVAGMGRVYRPQTTLVVRGPGHDSAPRVHPRWIVGSQKAGLRCQRAARRTRDRRVAKFGRCRTHTGRNARHRIHPMATVDGVRVGQRHVAKVVQLVPQQVFMVGGRGKVEVPQRS